MSLTDKQKHAADVELLRNGGKIGKAAADLGLLYDDVLRYVTESLMAKTYSTPRPELRKYIVASKDVNAAWPRTVDIERAHHEYDNGYVELCQWREGNVIHLLSIRRQRRAQDRRGYFSRVFEEIRR